MKTTTNSRLLDAIRSRGQKSEPFEYGILTADRFVQNMLDGLGIDQCYKFASRGTTSFNDILEKAAEKLVFYGKDMIVEAKGGLDDVGLPAGIQLPKNTLMVFRHVLTTNSKDRDGDVLHPEGAIIDPDMLLLWQHVHTLPIGKLIQVYEQNTKRLVNISCVVDMNELCHDAAVMIDNDMARFSHGFRALEFSEIKEGRASTGFDVRRFEIMEESLVSIPSNKGAKVDEVLLSLIEGGKLTSPLMKEMGKQMREIMPVTLPVNLDLKVSINGREVKDADKPANRTTEESRGKENDSGTSKEADGVDDKREETKETSDTEVKRLYSGDIEGSWEAIEQKLRDEATEYLRISGVSLPDGSWVGLLATYEDRTLLCVEGPSGGEMSYYQVSWSMEEGKPMFTGDPVAVEIDQTVTTTIRKPKRTESIEEKAGRSLSKANESKIQNAVEAMVDAMNLDGCPRPVKALLKEAVSDLKEVLTAVGAGEDTNDKQEITTSQAIAHVLGFCSAEERKQVMKLLATMETTDKENEMASQFRSAFCSD